MSPPRRTPKEAAPARAPRTAPPAAKPLPKTIPAKKDAEPAQDAEKPPALYQLKISLAGIRPEIFRRVVVPAGASLHALHTVIQRAFGWSDTLLHQFEIGVVLYSAPDPLSPADDDLGDDFADERTATLAAVLPPVGETFGYMYDYGDQWEHRILVEAVLPRHAPAACIGGARACPPEGCGGARAYRRLLQQQSAAEPAPAPDDDGLSELPEGFDPERFDLAAARDAVAAG